MTTPSSGTLRERLSTSSLLQTMAEVQAEKIFRDYFQGDELIDRIQDLMDSWGWLSEHNPDEDVRIECIITDEVWTRIIALILMHMQDTRRDGGR